MCHFFCFSRRYEKGLTLFELLIAIVILSVITGMAAPSFRQQILSEKTNGFSNEFSSAIQFARSQAIRTSGRVTLCASEDGVSCSDNWLKGFIVFNDTAASDQAAVPVIQDATAIYRVWTANPGLEAFTLKTDNDLTFLRFNSLGALVNTSKKPVDVVVKMTGCAADNKLQISVAGRVKQEPTAC